MPQTIITAGDAIGGVTSLTGGNDGTLALVIGPAGSKVTGLNIDAVGNVSVLGRLLSKEFVSVYQTITSGGMLTLPHGLSFTPTTFDGFLKCTTTENGWSVNDIVPLAQDPGNNRGCAFYADATNVYVRYGSNAFVFSILNKGTGTGAATTNTSWTFAVRARS